MAKKSFRPQKTASPNYPFLRDVDRSTVSRWGLLTLGGLLMSSPPARAELPPGEPPPTRAESTAPPSKSTDKAKTSPDAAVPVPPAPPMMGGAPVPQRVEKPVPAKSAESKKSGKKAKKNKGEKMDSAAQEQKGTAGSANAANTESVSLHEGLRGKVRMPRVEDKKPAK